MMNFECIDGPYAGQRFPVRGEPKEGLRRKVLILDSGQQHEAWYELRRHKTVDMITHAGIWQWHFINPTIVCLDCGWSGQKDQLVFLLHMGEEDCIVTKERACPQCRSLAWEETE